MLNMMEFKNEFVSRCRSELGNVWPGIMDIEEKTVHKAQRGDLTGLCFSSPGNICAPTIYVEDFYELYNLGLKMDHLSKEAVKSVICGFDLAKTLPAADFDIQSRPDMLRVRLLGNEGNESLLEEAPHLDIAEGLSLVVYTETGEYRALITENLLETTELTPDELFDAAFESSSSLEPAVLYDLSESVLHSPEERRNYLDDVGCGADAVEAADPAGTTYAAGTADPAHGRPLVLSNSDLFWGSSALFYPGVISKIHTLVDGDFYVLPSSVHELIIMPAGEADPAALEEILHSANSEVVDEADILSNDLYICESGHIRKVQS